MFTATTFGWWLVTELEIYTFPATGQRVRMAVVNNVTWFVGKDVASGLAYANPREAVRTHVPPAHKGGSESLPLAELGLDPQTVMITEAGMYRLIMRANTARAEEFQEWVTADVLPSIRKTGSYSVAPVAALPQSYSAALRELADTVEELDRTKVELAVAAPKVELADQFLTSDGTVYLNDIAKNLGMTQPELTKVLRARGVLYQKQFLYMQGYESWFRVTREWHSGKRDWVRALKVTRVGIQGIFALFSTLEIEGDAA